MDAERKAQLEKRLVVVLMGVFVVVFIMGPGKHLGLFKSGFTFGLPKTQQALAGNRVTVTKPVGVLLQNHWGQSDPLQQPKTTTRQADADTPEAAGGAYTASALRDPLEILLSKPPPQQLPDAGAPAPTVEAPTAQVPAPVLRVQGLLWGGPTPHAIIDGRIYGIGDEVAGATIVTIDRRGVTVDHLGNTVFYAIEAASPQAAWR